MTKKQVQSMTSEEQRQFVNVTCHSFDEGQTLEEYTEAIRAYIYIWRFLMEGRTGYTWDVVSKRVETEAAVIRKYYDAKAPVDEAATDVDFVGG